MQFWQVHIGLAIVRKQVKTMYKFRIAQVQLYHGMPWHTWKGYWSASRMNLVVLERFLQNAPSHKNFILTYLIILISHLWLLQNFRWTLISCTNNLHILTESAPVAWRACVTPRAHSYSSLSNLNYIAIQTLALLLWSKYTYTLTFAVWNKQVSSSTIVLII